MTPKRKPVSTKGLKLYAQASGADAADPRLSGVSGAAPGGPHSAEHSNSNYVVCHRHVVSYYPLSQLGRAETCLDLTSLTDAGPPAQVR